MNKDSPPLVSIVLPSYNHRHFIFQTIQSVLDQTYPNFELLIADDCSTDESLSVIKSFNDERIILFAFEQNQGAVPTLNFLCSKASGVYIAVINSDDYWRADKLEKQISFLETHRDHGACFSWAQLVDENDKFLTKATSNINVDIFRQPNRTQAEWLRYFYEHSNCICHASAVMRTEVMQQTEGYRVALRQIPDYNMWIRIISKNKVHIVQEDFVFYRWCVSDPTFNTSAASEENMVRGYNELMYTFMHFFDGVPDDIFQDGFQDLFVYKEASTPAELECEKVFAVVRLGYLLPSIKHIMSLFLFNDLLQKEDTRRALREKYDFVDRSYFELSGYSVMHTEQLDKEHWQLAYSIYRILESHPFLKKVMKLAYKIYKRIFKS